MALYRQIAGTPDGVPSDQVGLFWDGTSIYTGIMPPSRPDYVYTEPEPDPLTPLLPSPTDSTSPFADPREFDPGDLTPIETTTQVPTLNPSQPVEPTTSVLPADIKTAITNNFLPILALAGLVLVAVAGEDLLHEKRKFVFLGGIGMLYYGMAKNKI